MIIEWTTGLVSQPHSYVGLGYAQDWLSTFLLPFTGSGTICTEAGGAFVIGMGVGAAFVVGRGPGAAFGVGHLTPGGADCECR